MKAILRMEMPESCDKCDLCSNQFYEMGNYICLKTKDSLLHVKDGERYEYCPLEPENVEHGDAPDRISMLVEERNHDKAIIDALLRYAGAVHGLCKICVFYYENCPASNRCIHVMNADFQLDTDCLLRKYGGEDE